MKKRYHRVLTIAGSDSGGGAGIQADIKSISACGAYAASAITAVTVQNTLGVADLFPIPVEIIREQIDAVMSDIGADAIKIGMLHSAEVVKVVCDAIDRYQPRSVVLDPVMVSTSGHRLIEESAIEMLRSELLPRATIVTPNIPEAEIVLNRKITDSGELLKAAQELSTLSTQTKISVLLKAGHLDDDMLTDIFIDATTHENNIHKLSAKRIETKNTHGTGCTLSAAIAAFLAKGLSNLDAVRAAKEYLTSAITSGAEYEIGEGHGPVNHLFTFTSID